jgi:DNA-binding PadR family transcriptional regulator
MIIFPVTKVEVLAIFAKSGDFLKPDEVIEKLRSDLDRRSFYSYLGRLRRQGLLEPDPHRRRGQLAYRLTERGRERLAYLQERAG